MPVRRMPSQTACMLSHAVGRYELRDGGILSSKNAKSSGIDSWLKSTPPKTGSGPSAPLTYMKNTNLKSSGAHKGRDHLTGRCGEARAATLEEAQERCRRLDWCRGFTRDGGLECIPGSEEMSSTRALSTHHELIHCIDGVARRCLRSARCGHKPAAVTEQQLSAAGTVSVARRLAAAPAPDETWRSRSHSRPDMAAGESSHSRRDVAHFDVARFDVARFEVARFDVAILISGLPSRRSSSTASRAAVVRSWSEHVLQPLVGEQGAAVTGFLCGAARQSGSAEARGWISVFAPSHLSVVESGPGVRDQWQRLQSCFVAARRFEVDNSRGFTHFIRGRPDLQWYAHMPPLASVDPLAVTLRARELLYAEPTRSEAAALSAWWTPDGTCEGFRQTILSRAKAALVNETRDRMRTLGISTCACVDDQMAIVPSHLGSAYFSNELNQSDGHLEGNTASRANAARTSYGAFTWHARKSVASESREGDPQEEAITQQAALSSPEAAERARRSYGSAESALAYIRTCAFVWACPYDTIRRGCKFGMPEPSGRTAWPPWPSRPSDQFSTERRLTWRLTTRLVPYVVAPLYVRFEGVGDGTRSPPRHMTEKC